MRTIPIALQTHINASSTTMCELIKFTRQDGEVFAFTDHDRSLVFGGVRYQRVLGVEISDLEKTSDMGVGNGEGRGILEAVGITEADVIAGRWDQAAWERRHVNWANLAAGSILIDNGYTGKVSLSRNRFTIELLDLLQFLQAGIVDLISPRCRARLGDEWCTVDLGPFTVTGAIDGVDDPNWSVIDSTRTEEAAYFTRGIFTFDTGLNAGISREIKNYPGLGVFIFQLPFPFVTAEGDEYTAIAGCDGLKSTCKDKFDNIVNRQAEDNVAGDDKAMQVGRST